MSETERKDGGQSAEAKRAGAPEVVETWEGQWLAMPPPDRQPQFQCTVRPRGSIVRRVLGDGTSR